MDGISIRQNLKAIARRSTIAASAVSLALWSLSVLASAQTPENPILLQLETKIPLGPVLGRIDHMAIDLKRQRLFIAELGNDSVGIVDIGAHKTIHTIDDLAEPQGIGFVPDTDTIYVANANDGSVRLFRGTDYAAAGRIDLGSDADNIRLDSNANRILVGYGDGSIAAVDVTQQKKFGDIPLPAHPEGFQIGGEPKQVFVNLPGAHAVAVLDGASGTQKAKWPLHEDGNFPMALDTSTDRVLIVSRTPPKLIALAEEDGAVVGTADTCADSDDLFIDAKRGRVYVSCGAGFIDVFQILGSSYQRVGHIATTAGARTSLFVPELDRLFLAVRGSERQEAAIWVFRPAP